MFNIKISNKLKPFLIKLIKIKGGKKEFAKIQKISIKSLNRWINGTRNIPFKIIKEIVNTYEIKIDNLLDNEILTYERSGKEFKFRKNISIVETNLIGWILSEGSIEKYYRINISQKDKKCLINLQNKIKKDLNIQSTIEKDKEAYKLRISNAAFTTYLIKQYNLDIGKKYNKVKVPKIIFTLSKNKIISFLTGYIEGDGCISHYWRKDKRGKYKVPRIFICSTSLKILKDMQNLFYRLKITSKINKESRKRNTKWNNIYKLNITKIDDCIKLIYYIYSYLNHPESKKRIKNNFKDNELLSKIRIENKNNILTLLKNKLNLKRKELVNYFNKKLNYKINYYTMNGWFNGTHRPPLSIILHACDILKFNYLDYLPKEYKLFLKIQKII